MSPTVYLLSIALICLSVALIEIFRTKSRRQFDLATPDPDFPNFNVHSEDQLPGRPIKGKIEIDTFFQHLKLFVSKKQTNYGSGKVIFDHLKAHNLPVLGPNVGQFLYEHQDLIPIELRNEVTLAFWGKVYRSRGGVRFVRCLVWQSNEWVWSMNWIEPDEAWGTHDHAVLLSRAS